MTTDLKKLAAECAQAALHPALDIRDAWRLLSKAADALDAYADAQKPVAWRTKKREWDNGGLKRYYVCSESCGDGKSPFREGAGEPLYAAPPLPSVGRNELADAFANALAESPPGTSHFDDFCEALRALGITVTGGQS